MENRRIFRTREMAIIAVMTAITCILGPLSIPIGPVPISFTNLAIYLTVYVLGWKLGTISYFIYLLIGFAGVPVFSSFTGGANKLFGPTGGYLIGFIFMAIISGICIEKFRSKIWRQVVGMVVGTLVTYAFGTGWLAYQANMTFYAALMAGVVPFIVGDALKIAIACVLGNEIFKRMKRANLI